MKLTESQQRLAIDAINRAFPNPKRCPVCSKPGPWLVNDFFVELRDYNMGNLMIGGAPLLALLPVTCGTCSATQLFNAVHLGLIDQATGVVKPG